VRELCILGLQAEKSPQLKELADRLVGRDQVSLAERPFVLIPLGFLTSPFLIGLRLASDFGCFPRGMS